MLRALIFDVDGTLADTERDGHRVAFNLAFAEAGLDWHWDVPLYGDLLQITGGRERLQHFIQNYKEDISLSRREALAIDLHAKKTRHYLRLVNEGAVRLRPGVARLLCEAHHTGTRLAIATTTTRANVDTLLAHALPAGAAAWFEVIGAAENAQRKKPDPGVYRYVLAALAIAPSEALAFEDSAAGLDAARAAGIATLVTRNTYTDGQDFSAALAVLSDLGEPQAHASVIAGRALDRGYVDLAQLQAWHRLDQSTA